MTDNNSFGEFMEREVYNFASKAGTLASGRVDKSTISNMLSLFQGEADPLDAILLLITYVLRQMGRNEIPRHIGSIFISHLNEIFKKFRDNHEKLRSATQKYLVLMKWIYESNVRGRVNSFEELIQVVVSR